MLVGRLTNEEKGQRVCNQRPRCCEGNGGLRWNWQAARDGLPGTAAGGARSGGGTSECKGRVVAHGGPILLAQPGSLKARPKSLPSGKAGQVLELAWGVVGGHCPATGPELWGQPSGPSSLRRAGDFSP